ncbi:MAG: SurA N-terminal domain-containing protein [Candidatus Omnitrophota bacterium]
MRRIKMLKRWAGFLLFGAVPYLLLAAAGVPAHAEMVDKVIVVVNDEVITQREFDRAFTPVKQSYEANFKGDELMRRQDAARKGILEQLINTKLAISLAKKGKIEADEQELKSRIDKIKGYYENEEMFLQALNEKGTNLTEFEKEIREQMLAQKLVDKEVMSKIVVTPAEIKELYDSNREKLVSPDRVKVRGILIKKTEGAEEGADLKRMEAVMSRVVKGEDFITVATEISEGPYAATGGDMGYIARGQTLREIDEAIFTLKPGQKSDIVETDIGYHVFLVEDVQKARPLEYDEVSDFLKDQLFRKKFQEALMKWLDVKRKDAYISYK